MFFVIDSSELSYRKLRKDVINTRKKDVRCFKLKLTVFRFRVSSSFSGCLVSYHDKFCLKKIWFCQKILQEWFQL